MDITLTANEVQDQIKRLYEEGNALTKKKIKKTHPDLMRSALHYYPNWDHALKDCGVS